MCYHANACKQCSDVLHVGLGYAGLLCSLPLFSMFPRLCSGRIPYVLVFDCDVLRKFPVRVECDDFMYLFSYEVCRCDTFGKMFPI